MPGEGEAGGFAKLRPKYVPSMSVRTWYPFIAEDLIDEGGVFLGYTSTRSPIFFNPFRRNNYNVVILGETGAGKSMTAKVLIKRLKEKNPELRVFGLDPRTSSSRGKSIRRRRAQHSAQHEAGPRPLQALP